MSLYHEAAEILTSSDTGGSLKSRVFGKKKGKAPPGQLYALVLETAKWSPVLKEVIEKADILRLERKVRKFLSPHDCLVLGTIFKWTMIGRVMDLGLLTFRSSLFLFIV